jgi:hypothetical protein
MASTYLVFQLTASEDTEWSQIDTYIGASADAAIRAAGIEHGPGTYAATPARSWTPRIVKVESKASFA